MSGSSGATVATSSSKKGYTKLQKFGLIALGALTCLLAILWALNNSETESPTEASLKMEQVEKSKKNTITDGGRKYISHLQVGESTTIEIPKHTMISTKKNIDHDLVWKCDVLLQGVATCSGEKFTLPARSQDEITTNCEVRTLTNESNTLSTLIITRTN